MLSGWILSHYTIYDELSGPVGKWIVFISFRKAEPIRYVCVRVPVRFIIRNWGLPSPQSTEPTYQLSGKAICSYCRSNTQCFVSKTDVLVLTLSGRRILSYFGRGSAFCSSQADWISPTVIMALCFTLRRAMFQQISGYPLD
jgi:hypothetical protein